MNTEYFQHRDDPEIKAVPYHYKRCGLDNVYLVNGFDVEVDEDGDRYVCVLDIEVLHQAIGVHLVTNRKILSPAELRFLRKTMDLTQSELGRTIGQSGQQIARWEKGENKIPGPADRLLRLLFLHSVIGASNATEEPMEFLGRLDELDAEPEGDLSFSHNDEGWLETA